MVEHTAVNRGVVGSSPTRGAKKTVDIVYSLFFTLLEILHIQHKRSPPDSFFFSFIVGAISDSSTKYYLIRFLPVRARRYFFIYFFNIVRFN